VDVEPVDFLVGPVSRGAAALLAGMTLGYALLTGIYAVRGLRAQLDDRWSAVVATVVMALLGLTLWRDGAELLPAPFSVFVLIVALAGIVLTLTYTLGRYQERIERFKVQFGERLSHLLDAIVPEERQKEWERLRVSWRPTTEERRKIPHLLMGLFLLFYAGLGYLVLRAAWDLLYGADAAILTLDGGEGIRNLYLASHSGILAAGQVFSLTCLLGLLYVLVPTELLRLKYPELSYPFKSLILTRLRPRERGLFGAHYYLAAATPLAVLWLTADPARWDATVPAAAAVLVVTIYADAASALIGIRYGERKFGHNPRKSYAGAIGGTVVAFLATLPLLGLPGALASAAVFLLIDLIAPVPVFISDNLLYPVALSVVYLAMVDYIDPWFAYY
jgi:dolichol kinase